MEIRNKEAIAKALTDILDEVELHAANTDQAYETLNAKCSRALKLEEIRKAQREVLDCEDKLESLIREVRSKIFFSIPAAVRGIEKAKEKHEKLLEELKAEK